MTDRFSHTAPSFDGPANHAFSITPDDGNDLEEVSRAVYCGQAGDVVVRTPSGNDVTFANVGAGTVLPVRATRVLATGTSAASLVGLV